jgi:rubrerythrin
MHGVGGAGRYVYMARKDLPQQETLRLWHCPECGYANVGRDPCAGCHKRAPRRVRSNTKEYLRTHSESPPQH